MRLIAERLDATTIVSVGHRPELEAFHDRKLVLEGASDGARLVSDEELPDRGSWFRWPKLGRSEEAAPADEHGTTGPPPP